MAISRLRSIFVRRQRTRESDKNSEEKTLTPSPFIVGVGRSGTTMLRLMLDAHPDLAIPPETHFLPQAALACERAPDPRQAFLETVRFNNPRWGDYHIEGDLLARRIAAIEPFNLSEAVRAFYGLYTEKFGKRRWGDKTPHYLRKMELIQSLLPEAHFIHLIRDGRDVAMSAKGLSFGHDTIEEAARQWRSWIKRARSQSQNLDFYLEVRYEDLVLNTESTLKKVVDFIDLPWSTNMLDYHATAEKRISEIHRDVLTPSGEALIRGQERKAMHSLTSEPPRHDRIGRWKSEMTHADRERFEEIASKTLRDLGYEIG
jgi:Sulfotransferase family